MKSMALMLRRFALAGFALVGACFSAGDKDGDGDGGGGSGQCNGFAPLPCRCSNGLHRLRRVRRRCARRL